MANVFEKRRMAIDEASGWAEPKKPKAKKKPAVKPKKPIPRGKRYDPADYPR